MAINCVTIQCVEIPADTPCIDCTQSSIPAVTDVVCGTPTTFTFTARDQFGAAITSGVSIQPLLYVSTLAHLGNGLWQAQFTPPCGAAPATVGYSIVDGCGACPFTLNILSDGSVTCTTATATISVTPLCITNPQIVINGGSTTCKAGEPISLEMTGCCGAVKWVASNLVGPGTVVINDENANPTTMVVSEDGEYASSTINPGGYCCL